VLGLADLLAQARRIGGVGASASALRSERSWPAAGEQRVLVW